MDVLIVGGGASGIACAIRLKQNMPSLRVTVLEHLEEPCKKLYATGNGRCNITNIAADGYEITSEFFTSLGLILKESHEGRMYPYSNQAATVVNVLLSACKKYGVQLVNEVNVYRLERCENSWRVYTTKGVFSGDYVVMATGGKAQSALGSDGSGYALLEELGHTVTPLAPALVQLESSNKHCRQLKGVRTKCRLSIETDGEITASSFGELLFADYGISGIVTMDLSENVHDDKLKRSKERCVAIVDFVPDMTEEALLTHYEQFGSLEGVLPAKLCTILTRQADGDAAKMVKYAKHWRLIITGTKGYNFAQITKGGIPTSELGENNESRLHKNLYIIGELTDNQYRCGGFNLDYAFSSGVKAADGIVRAARERNTE